MGIQIIDEISELIATGFDISLQDEIIHADPKKKIHYLMKKVNS